MHRLLKLACIYFCVFSIEKAQPNPSSYFIANELANNGNFQSAFAILQSEASKNDCKALGYYWIWCLQKSSNQLDSYTFELNTKIKNGDTKNLLAQSYSYQFDKKNYLTNLVQRCKNEGTVKNQNLFFAD